MGFHSAEEMRFGGIRGIVVICITLRGPRCRDIAGDSVRRLEMGEDGFADDRITYVVLSDVTLWGNSQQLEKFDRESVEATRDRLIAEGYAHIVKGRKPPAGARQIDRSVMNPKGRELFQRLKRKLKEVE